MVKYLGEEGKQTLSLRLCLWSNPFDLNVANAKMSGWPKNFIYSRHLVKGLVRYYQR